MYSLLKDWFTHKCPDCGQPLEHQNSYTGYSMQCPNEHYLEETYYHLGVRIIYKD